jgi:UDP-N-acetylmuramate dehydrogenase
LTTLCVGGPARFFCAPTTSEDVHAALSEARARGLPVFVLGEGSNLVIADAGWPGLVLKPRLGSTRSTETGFTVGAGVRFDALVDHCVSSGCGGLECLAGIPGSVGATPIQNVGAYGQEVAETIVGVTALDRQSLLERGFSNAECDFGYRRSRFNSYELGRWLILDVRFAPRRDCLPTLKYRDLQAHFGPDASPSLAEVAAAVRKIRACKGMVLNPADPDSRSVGSFFKNPATDGVQLPEHAPRFAQADGSVKVPAAWLIEQAGLVRGQTLCGDIAISTKHVLALTHSKDVPGARTAADVAASARLVQERVYATFGIVLAPEPVFVGFGPLAALPEGAIRIEP